MIIQKLLELILNGVLGLLDLLPTLNFSIPTGILNVVGNALYGINYFVPIKDVLPILIISFAITGFRIVWASIIRIKSFIPMMGA